MLTDWFPELKAMKKRLRDLGERPPVRGNSSSRGVDAVKSEEDLRALLLDLYREARASGWNDYLRGHVDGLEEALGLDQDDEEEAAEETDFPDGEDSSTESSEPSSPSSTGDDEEVECPWCEDTFHPRGIGPHKAGCPENPENQDDGTPGGLQFAYRCGSCTETFRSRDELEEHKPCSQEEDDPQRAERQRREELREADQGMTA